MEIKTIFVTGYALLTAAWLVWILTKNPHFVIAVVTAVLVDAFYLSLWGYLIRVKGIT